MTTYRAALLAWLWAIALTGLSFHTGSAQGLSGFYIRTEMGANVAPQLTLLSSSTDGGSVCDPIINPSAASTPGCPSQGTGWKSVFDSARGMLASAAVGYQFHGLTASHILRDLRIEVAYLYRNSNYDQTSPILSQSGVARDKLSNEVAHATERVSSLTTAGFLLNLNYDFRIASRITLFLGLGAGAARTALDTGRIWARENDPDAIATGEGLSNADEIRNNLAGTVSVALTKSSATQLGYQLIAGIGYAVADAFTISLNSHFMGLGPYAAADGLDLLRSHAPPTDYARDLETNRLTFIGVGLATTYSIGR